MELLDLIKKFIESLKSNKKAQFQLIVIVIIAALIYSWDDIKAGFLDGLNN